MRESTWLGRGARTCAQRGADVRVADVILAVTSLLAAILVAAACLRRCLGATARNGFPLAQGMYSANV